MTSQQINLHATGILFDNIGILIRGRSGAGKSLLALGILQAATLEKKSAYLVSDDQVLISIVQARLQMQSPRTIAGKIELRGFGIVSRPHVETAQVDLVVDLVQDMCRLPPPAQFSTEIEGVTLARCPVPERGDSDSAHQLMLVAQAISQLNADG